MDSKTGYSVNSGFVSGMKVKDAMAAVIDRIEEMGIGHRTVNYRLRDAIFSRQRYWGEPFPVYYKDGRPQMLPEECLPLELPEVSDFKPTGTGEPPLGNAKVWVYMPTSAPSISIGTRCSTAMNMVNTTMLKPMP